MKFHPLSFAALALLSGCASPNETPISSSPVKVMMAPMLFGAFAASAQGGNRVAEEYFEVKVSPEALELVSSIRSFRMRTQTWPKNEDVLPIAGVSSARFIERDGTLEIIAEKDQVLVLQCRFEQDGSIAFAPPYEKLVRLFQTIFQK